MNKEENYSNFPANFYDSIVLLSIIIIVDSVLVVRAWS